MKPPLAKLRDEGVGAEPDQVLSLSTGVIGVQLNLEKIGDAVSPLVAALGDDPEPYATAILTTDEAQVHRLQKLCPDASIVRLEPDAG